MVPPERRRRWRTRASVEIHLFNATSFRVNYFTVTVSFLHGNVNTLSICLHSALMVAKTRLRCTEDLSNMSRFTNLPKD